MGFVRIMIAVLCLFGGMILTLTFFGAILGIPMIALSIFLIYKEQKLSAKESIKGGITEALKERDEKDDIR